jgi:hypothetical protein
MQASRKDTAEAAAVCGPAIRLLAETLARETDAFARWRVAEGLSALAGRLPPAEAAAVCGPPAFMLAEALAKATDAGARANLAEGLSAVAERLLPVEAAHLLAEALAKATDADVCKTLAQTLVIATDRVERAEAARICEQVLALVQRREASPNPWWARMKFRGAASVMLPLLAEEEAHSIALQQARETAAAPDVNRRDDRSELRQVVLLDRLLSGGTLSQRRRCAVATATAVGLAFGGPATALAASPSAAEPLPCRLTTPELVALLKYPTCIGPARQVVLKHLGQRYGRSFTNHWEFVRFAKDQRLDLDFTSPPKRPLASSGGVIILL